MTEFANHFDQIIDRTNTASTKWEKFAPDVLPMWVADMDFAAPSFILDGLRKRLDHPILGYTTRPDSLNLAFCNWLEHHFNWQIDPEWVVWIPGVVPGLNLSAQLLDKTAKLIIPTPVYHPFLDLAEHAQMSHALVPSYADSEGLWQWNWPGFEASNPQTQDMVMICNPQNPTGRVYTESELQQLAAFSDYKTQIDYPVFVST